MINRSVLVGRLTKDPELKYTQSGVAVTRFTLAVNRTFTTEGGEREADFIQCVAWRKLAENTANYLKKGSLAGVEGRIQTGSFDGQDGKKVYTTEVICDSVQFLEPRNKDGASNNSGGSYGGGQQQGNTNTQSYGQTQSQGTQNTYTQQQNNNAPPQYQSNQNQQNYTRTDNDPFSTGGGPIKVSDDDLPF